jgi:FdhE protein
VTSTSDTLSSRAARARLLAGRYPAAADVLAFYARLVEYQSSLLGGGDDMPDEARLAAMVAPFLDWLKQQAPGELPRAATELQHAPGDWRERFARAFTTTGNDGSDPVAMFVVESILQPWAERQAKAGSCSLDPAGPKNRTRPTTALDRTPARCPACGCPPVVGVLREEGHGARRGLVCVRCAAEWAYRRVCCPSCGEEDFDTLPVYTAEPYPHIRVEACDRCRTYLKSVDLTKDGLAIPQVDDLASLPLDLWARERGYIRLQANLLRT